LQKQYPVTRIRFMDLAIHVGKLVKIADEIIRRKMDVTWSAVSRFDEGWTDAALDTLWKSGCRSLVFGLEAASQRVNDLIEKGIRNEEIQPTCDRILGHGFEMLVGAMIGFPGETEQEMLETAEFLKRNMKNELFRGALAIFALNAGSYVYDHADEYGITGLEGFEEYFFKDGLDYSIPGKLPRERLLEIRKMLPSAYYRKAPR